MLFRSILEMKIIREIYVAISVYTGEIWDALTHRFESKVKRLEVI